MSVESTLKFHLLKYVPDKIKFRLKEKFNKWNSKSCVPEIPEKFGKQLLQIYYQDISGIQSMTGMDLNSWLK
jgi:hypothetical protein